MLSSESSIEHIENLECWGKSWEALVYKVAQEIPDEDATF